VTGGTLRAAPPPVDALGALRRAPRGALKLLSEIKFRSPSAGNLSQALDAAARAVVYAEAGTRAISVLCDGPFFGGSYTHLAEARRALDESGHGQVPLLAKEFIVDRRQVQHARASGASLVLLIVRILDGRALPTLVNECRSLGMEPLVEVTDEAELERALAADATIVGVNARDLDTLTMDAARAARVLERIPEGLIALHLSGVKTPDDVRRLRESRADGALVGEALMRQDDPRPLLSSLVKASVS
jgi:indole-3-glycerol phosphate synthase